ncbi:hypothetical protein CO111_05715 [Candidatus Desantisbacteria bacterium CG_4_9_14_3_um_filter_50_7]|nr:MAG: hypothetical protein CO111_05715 [Candidatus Desantisbacteria bacterium CG_4_9_14_3_um_filter_50_7]
MPIAGRILTGVIRFSTSASIKTTAAYDFPIVLKADTSVKLTRKEEDIIDTFARHSAGARSMHAHPIYINLSFFIFPSPLFITSLTFDSRRMTCPSKL